MQFQRNIDVKDALNIGIAKNLPIWMKDQEDLDYKNYWDVWKWAIEERKDFMFPYIVERRGKKWMGREKIIIGMDDNNSLLWESIGNNYLPAVNAILAVENLFIKEAFTLRLEATKLSKTFKRGDQKVHYRATSFGSFVSLAMNQAKGNFEIQDALMNYYKKYHNEL